MLQKGAALQNAQLLGCTAQGAHAGLGDGAGVFDADAAQAGHIDAGLHGDDVAGGQDLIGPAGNAGLLMDIDAHAMAGAVAEALAVAGLGDDIAGDFVDLRRGHTGRDGRLGRLLGAQHDIIDLAHLVAGLTHRHGAGHIGVVAVLAGAEIDGDHVPFLDLPIAGHRMGQGAVFAGGHDGIEGQAVGPQLQHLVIQGQLHLALGPPGGDEAADVLEGLAGDIAGVLDAAKLVVVLDLAQLFHLEIQRREADAGHDLFDLPHAADGDDVILDGQIADARVLQQLVGHRRMADTRADGVHREPGTLLLSGLHIAEIGNHGIDARGQQQQSLPRVPAEIKDVGRIMNQHAGFFRQAGQ